MMRLVVELDEKAEDGLSYEEHVLGIVAHQIVEEARAKIDHDLNLLIEGAARERVEQALDAEITRQVTEVKLNGYIAGHSFHDATWSEVIGKVIEAKLGRLRDGQWESDRSPAAAAIKKLIEQELVKDINQSLASVRAELRGTMNEKAAEVLAETVRRTVGVRI